MSVAAVVATVPGKLILMGEHAAVYGRPALVAAAGLTVEVELRPRPAGVALELETLGRSERTDWGTLVDAARAARAAWERYRDDPTPERFAALGGPEPARVVRLALGEVAAELAPSEPPPATVRVRSRLPVGSGLGSSAAVAVGTVAAALRFCGELPARERVDRLALEVERRQHGLPSGVDHGTVLAGGVVRARRGECGLELEALAADPARLERFEVFHTGEPAESTGAVVAAVAARRAADAAAFERRLDRMTAAVERFAATLAAAESSSEPAAPIGDYQRQLEALGVVPPSVARAVRRVEGLGCAAKISGAGALSEPGAGCLLVYRPPEADDPEPALAGYRRLRFALGVPGLRLEERAS